MAATPYKLCDLPSDKKDTQGIIAILEAIPPLGKSRTKPFTVGYDPEEGKLCPPLIYVIQHAQYHSSDEDAGEIEAFYALSLTGYHMEAVHDPTWSHVGSVDDLYLGYSRLRDKFKI